MASRTEILAEIEKRKEESKKRYKAYQHEYYLRVTKPKREKERVKKRA